jgi:Tfp pilus assembly PilM family ATPase
LAKRAIGLDIGSFAVKLVELVKTKEGILVNKVVSLSLPPSTGEEEKRRLTIQTVRKIFVENKIRPRSVILSVSGQSVFTRTIKIFLPTEVNARKGLKLKKLDRIIGFEAKQQIPFPLNEVVWDYQLLPTREPRAQDVLLVAMKNSLLETQVRQMQEAGFKSNILDIAPLACYNCLRFNQDFTPGRVTALIDIGAKGTNIIIFKDDDLWMKNIPIGLERVSMPRADSMVSLEDLINEIKSSIEYYYFQKREEGFTGGSIEEVILSGGGAQVPELMELLKSKLGVVVRKINPFRALVLDPKQSTIENNTIYATAVGLALRGLTRCAFQINLFKEREEKKKSWRRSLLLKVSSFILLIGIVSLFSFVGTKNYNLKKSKLERLDKLIEASSIYTPKIKTLLAERKALGQKLASLYTITQNRSLVGLDMLAEIGGILPSDVWITDLSCNFSLEKGLGQSTLRLKSLSYQGVNGFLLRIKSSPYFKNIRPLSSSIKEGQTKTEEIIEFIVTMETISPSPR